MPQLEVVIGETETEMVVKQGSAPLNWKEPSVARATDMGYCFGERLTCNLEHRSQCCKSAAQASCASCRNHTRTRRCRPGCPQEPGLQWGPMERFISRTRAELRFRLLFLFSWQSHYVVEAGLKFLSSHGVGFQACANMPGMLNTANWQYYTALQQKWIFIIIINIKQNWQGGSEGGGICYRVRFPHGGGREPTFSDLHMPWHGHAPPIENK